LTVKNSKLPSAADVRVRATPVAVLVSDTVAAGTTAPVVSRTVPTIDAVSNCAYAGAQAHSSRSTPIVRRTAVGIGILQDEFAKFQ